MDEDDFTDRLPQYPARTGDGSDLDSRPVWSIGGQLASVGLVLKAAGLLLLAAGGCWHWLWVVVMVGVAAGVAVGVLLKHVSEPEERR